MNFTQKMIAGVLIFLGLITMIHQGILVTLFLAGKNYGGWGDLVWFVLGFLAVMAGAMILDAGEQRAPYQPFHQQTYRQRWPRDYQ